VRTIWPALLLLLVACDLHLPWRDPDAWQDDLNELAVATFVTERSERGLPVGRLEFRAGNIYSTEPVAGPGGQWVWQVRYPRVDGIRVPVSARDRLAGIEVAVDVVMRFEQRYCALGDGPSGRLHCQAWVGTSCCNLVWKRSRGGWLAARP
jgi:hypothetical protein